MHRRPKTTTRERKSGGGLFALARLSSCLTTVFMLWYGAMYGRHFRSKTIICLFSESVVNLKGERIRRWVVHFEHRVLVNHIMPRNGCAMNLVKSSENFRAVVHFIKFVKIFLF
jgi:hypothetical protein